MGWANLHLVVVHVVWMLVAPAPAAWNLCPPDFCANVTCKPIKAKDCDGKVEPRASDCGCCEQCVKQLNEGDICFDFTMYGLAKWAECKEGLKCYNKRSKCVRIRNLPFQEYDDDAADEDAAILAYL